MCDKERILALTDITTISKYPDQLDHIIVRKSIKHLIITDCYFNFISDHKTIVLRISSFANDEPLETPQRIAVDKSTNDISINTSLQHEFKASDKASEKIKPELEKKTKEIKKEHDQSIPITSTLSQLNLNSLKGNNWISNFLIDDYCELLMAKYNNVFIFSSLFTESFFNRNKPFNHVSRYCKNTNILEMKLVFFPILNSSHWFLACLNNESHEICIYDPYLQGVTTTILTDQHMIWLNKLEKDFLKLYNKSRVINDWIPLSKKVMLPPEIPEQLDGFNCGIFMIEFMRHLCNNAEFKFSGQDMAKSRQRMMSELKNGQLEAFDLFDERSQVHFSRIF